MNTLLWFKEDNYSDVRQSKHRQYKNYFIKMGFKTFWQSFTF